MKLEFTKDYANKKKGDKAEYDGMLSRTLIDLGVAKKQGEKPKKVKKSK